MPLRTAGRLCPHGVFLDNRHDLYSQWSDRIAAILARHARAWKWLRSMKPISISAARSVCTARR